MDKRQAQLEGARDHATPGQPYGEPSWEDFPVRLMYTHGWRTGHKSCDCPVMFENRDINASRDMTVDGT
jgi:hypothetical protein